MRRPPLLVQGRKLCTFDAFERRSDERDSLGFDAIWFQNMGICVERRMDVEWTNGFRSNLDVERGLVVGARE